MLSQYQYGVLLLAVLLGSVTPSAIFAQTPDTDTEVLFIKEFLAASMNLLEQKIQQGDMGGAKYISKTMTEVFPQSFSA
ncbi:MAG: hypothetical protein KC440_09350, partial [Nitrosarchaeum sp.]|nr:hypothetical protein [Nitrosarchaeum sp.]